MKTLRETIDQLDEISRRDVLKGAGAAVAGAVGGKAKADWDMISKLDLLTGVNHTTGFINKAKENPTVELVMNKWPDIGGSGFIVIVSPVGLSLPPPGTLGRLVGKQGLVATESPYRMLIGGNLYNSLSGGIFPGEKGTGMILAVADSFNSQFIPIIADAVKNKQEIKIEISNSRQVFTFSGENTWSPKERVKEASPDALAKIDELEKS